MLCVFCNGHNLSAFELEQIDPIIFQTIYSNIFLLLFFFDFEICVKKNWRCQPQCTKFNQLDTPQPVITSSPMDILSVKNIRYALDCIYNCDSFFDFPTFLLRWDHSVEKILFRLISPSPSRDQNKLNKKLKFNFKFQFKVWCKSRCCPHVLKEKCSIAKKMFYIMIWTEQMSFFLHSSWMN